MFKDFIVSLITFAATTPKIPQMGLKERMPFSTNCYSYFWLQIIRFYHFYGVRKSFYNILSAVHWWGDRFDQLISKLLLVTKYRKKKYYKRFSKLQKEILQYTQLPDTEIGAQGEVTWPMLHVMVTSMQVSYDQSLHSKELNAGSLDLKAWAFTRLIVLGSVVISISLLQSGH